MTKKHKTDSSTWAKVIATTLILAIIGLAYVSIWQPGATGDWRIKINGIGASGSSLVMGFAVILLAILWCIWPDLSRAIFEIARLPVDLLHSFFHRFSPRK